MRIVVILLVGWSLLARAEEVVNPQVYLLIGQSNMAGRAPIGEAEKEPLARCLLLNANGEWEPASNPLNRFSTIRKGLGMQKVNPGYSFAKKLLAADKTLTVGLVVNAKGGSSIRQWKKGDKFYDEAVRRTQQAMKKGELAGVLWHQGESDQNDAEYLAKLKELIANLRKDLGSPELPFVAGQVNKVELINKQVARLPAEVPLTAFASSEGLTCMDRWHFDAKSMKTLGERYADAILNLRKNSGGAGRVIQPAGSR